MLNPELSLMLSRREQPTNAALQAELKATYIRKAWRCGMTLEGYCKRFGINMTWERNDGRMGTAARVSG